MKETIHPSQLAVLPQNPTVDQAVDYMKTSIDIVDWNLKRRRVIKAVGRIEYLNGYIPSNDSYVVRIESGLIKQVLTGSTAHKPFKRYAK